MKTASRALAVLLLPFLASHASAGAPAAFDVKGAEVQVRRAAGSAEVRIVYDVAVQDAACGWFLAEFDALPGGDAAPKASLLIDGKEYAAQVEERDGDRSVQAFRDDRQNGVKLLASKSLRLVLAFPAAAAAGPEISVAIPNAHSAFGRRGEGKPPTEIPSVTVRFTTESPETSAEMRATFRAVATGSRVVLRSDARSAGATLVK